MAIKTEARKPTRKRTAAGPKRTVREELNGAPAEPARSRRLKLPAYRPFRLKRIKYPERLPNAWRLSIAMWRMLWRRRGLFIGIAAVYGILTVLLVNGLSGSTDIATLKQQFDLGGGVGALASSIAVFATLLVSSGSSTSADNGAYQLILGLITSLATIWAVRQTMADRRVTIRDAFYRGMYPLIPFVLVLLVVLLQTVPLLIGGWLYSTVTVQGIAATGLEQALWGGLFAALAFASVYMLCSSLFALYIVTLPDMTPMKALRSARQLVRYRRGQVVTKLLFLVVMLLVAAAVIMVPLIIVVPVVAQWIFFVLPIFGLVIVHAYMYTVYKALLA